MFKFKVIKYEVTNVGTLAFLAVEISLLNVNKLKRKIYRQN